MGRMTPLKLGVILASMIFILMLLPYGSGGNRASFFKNLTVYEEALWLIPGLSLITYSRYPDSLVGKLGELFWRLYLFVEKGEERRKQQRKSNTDSATRRKG